MLASNGKMISDKMSEFEIRKIIISVVIWSTILEVFQNLQR